MSRGLSWLLASLAAGCAPAWSPCGVLVPEGNCPAAMALLRFADDNVCPIERVATRVREDLAFHRFGCQDPTRKGPSHGAHYAFGNEAALASKCAERPPDEVARDAERLALWRRLKAEDWDGLDHRFSSVVEVEGCGRRRFYACWRGLSRGSPLYLCEGGSLNDLGDKDPPADP
jgi:hypothetical protein